MPTPKEQEKLRPPADDPTPEQEQQCEIARETIDRVTAQIRQLNNIECNPRNIERVIGSLMYMADLLGAQAQSLPQAPNMSELAAASTNAYEAAGRLIIKRDRLTYETTLKHSYSGPA